MDANSIIIINPGSQNLRIGRAADLNPLTILHAIGRRRKANAESQQHHDTMLPPVHDDLKAEFEEHRLQVSHTIATFVTRPGESGGGTKRMRVATPPQQIATFNRRSVPEEFDEVPDADPEVPAAETIFDRDIIKLTVEESSAYNVHFPMRRGMLHLHNSIGGSMAAVLADLEVIWQHAISRLGIELAQLPYRYSAVLVIPDIYHRGHLRELVTLLLQRLRFRSCFLLQEHVAATFGAGLAYACVVDIGDQKCSVSCVEDGISQPDTRVRLGYGSGDVTQVLLMQLRKCAFPYRECNVEGGGGYADAELVQQLKERYCHLHLEVCGAQERTFEVRKSNKIWRYTLQMGDECIVAPFALFHTELLNITGKPKVAHIQLRSSQQADPEDCFDADYIRETGRRNGREAGLEGGSLLPVTGDVGVDDDLVVVDALLEEREMATQKGNDKVEQLYLPNGQIAALDLAIVRSIERCVSEENKRKMFGCILLVGGGSKCPGLTKWLEQKIQQQLLVLNRTAAEHQQPVVSYEVNVYTKEMDASMIGWKGAAIMSCLESANELWMHAAEWNKNGLRVLREKAPFIW